MKGTEKSSEKRWWHRDEIVSIRIAHRRNPFDIRARLYYKVNRMYLIAVPVEFTQGKFIGKQGFKTTAGSRINTLTGRIELWTKANSKK